MVDLKPVSAFAGLLKPIGHGAGVTVSERTGLGIATIIAGRDKGSFTVRMLSAFGITLEDGPGRAISHGVSFIGISRGVWLAIAPGGPGFATDLAARLSGAAHVADQSGAYGVLRLSGPKVHDTLAKGLPVDLQPRAFAADQSAVSSIAHMGVTLWQIDDDPPGYDLLVARSTAGSFWRWLEASAHEYGLSVVDTPDLAPLASFPPGQGKS
jgi:sarcosine oxidase subunit gamma